LARLEVLQEDITSLKVDAIVNAANATLLGGGGVDGAIHMAAGHQLLEECKSLCGCETGRAKLTRGYKLPAKYVIHAVGPVWQGGEKGEEDLLAGCYRHSMELARQNAIKSIAFPCISTGVYRFPKELAANIAVQTVKACLRKFPDIERVVFCCFSDQDFSIYTKLLNV